MKAQKKHLIKIVLSITDRAIKVLLAMGLPAMKAFSRLGGRRLPKSREFMKKNGVYIIRDHYYQPLFNDKRLKFSPKKTRRLPGIDLQEEKQLNLLKKMKCTHELISLKLENPARNEIEFCIDNKGFCSGDAEFLYQMVRLHKPKRIIEVGSGESTKIANLACKQNLNETREPVEHHCIEPYEQAWLEKLGVNVIRTLVEDCDLDMFCELEKNDLLFIDSSHIIRPQGDVLKEYLEIIPTLKPGVIVHVHDIFTPKDYLEELIREDVLLWNEQYLLEAILTNTSRYEILASLNHLHHNYYAELKKVCPYLKKSREPGSLYFRIKPEVCNQQVPIKT